MKKTFVGKNVTQVENIQEDRAEIHDIDTPESTSDDSFNAIETEFTKEGEKRKRKKYKYSRSKRQKKTTRKN